MIHRLVHKTFAVQHQSLQVLLGRGIPAAAVSPAPVGHAWQATRVWVLGQCGDLLESPYWYKWPVFEPRNNPWRFVECSRCIAAAVGAGG